MKIRYYKKNVYGQELLYIKDAQIALTVRRLTGNKTISDNDIENLEALGHTFEQVLQP